MVSSLKMAGAAFLVVCGSLAAAAPAHAEWRLSEGPFTTASDVTAHNRMPLDVKEVNDALASGDWPAALVKFGFGGNFENHSLAKFTDDYNGRLSSHVPTGSGHFGTPSYQNHALVAALTGSGRFAQATPEARAAFVDAGLVAVVINWSRYELGESARKAKLAEPNWSLQNGSPKNWNEIFAFYWGPEGKHSAFERVASLDGGSEINDALLATLAEGQEELVAEKWAGDAADKIAETLDAASTLLLADALEKAVNADDADVEAARAAAAGYWLAAADALADDAALAEAVEAALSGDVDREKIRAAAELINAAG